MNERELIKDMKILLECTDMGGLQRRDDVLINRAIELLAQPEQGLYDCGLGQTPTKEVSDDIT